MNTVTWGGPFDFLLRKAGAFDETAHPRVPAGSERGGQFAPKGEGEEGLGAKLKQLPFEMMRGHGSYYKKFDDEFNAFKRRQQEMLAAHGVTWEQYQDWLKSPPVAPPAEVWHNGPLTDSKGRGIFFGEQKAMADNFAFRNEFYTTDKYRVHLKNPMTAKNAYKAIWMLDEKTAYKLFRDRAKGTGAKYIAVDGSGRKSFFNTLWQEDLDRQVMKFAKARGYDGMIYTESDSGSGLEVVVFDKNAVEKV